jgi:hypothetical protein
MQHSAELYSSGEFAEAASGLKRKKPAGSNQGTGGLSLGRLPSGAICSVSLMRDHGRRALPCTRTMGFAQFLPRRDAVTLYFEHQTEEIRDEDN